MSKINLKEFNKLVKHYQELYDKAEVGSFDHAMKGTDVALLEQVSLLITGDDSEDKPKKKTPIKSKDEVKEKDNEPLELNETAEIVETNEKADKAE